MPPSIQMKRMSYYFKRKKMTVEQIEAIFKRYRSTQIGELCKFTYELMKQLEEKEDERKEIKEQGSEGGESDR